LPDLKSPPEAARANDQKPQSPSAMFATRTGSGDCPIRA
jgi:hypothetical protein